MKKETFNMIIRFLVGLAASLLICAGMIMTEKIGSNKPLLQQASGLKGTETVLTVDGEAVSAEEYLYMVSYSAQTLSYYGITDLNTELGDDYTAADYVAEQARSQVKQQAAIRKWAADKGVTLTEEDAANLQAQKDGYGDELDTLLKVNGISEEQYDRLMNTSMLYSRLYDTYCAEGGSLRPSDSELSALAEEHVLMTGDVLTISTGGMDDAAKAEAKALLDDYRQRLAAAEDNASAFAELEVGDGVVASAGVTYDGCEETALTKAMAALGEGAVSAVIEDEGAYYVVVRRATDLSVAAELLFGEDMSARIENAQVELNESVFGRIDIATFYIKFSAAQQKLYTSLSTTQG